MKGLLKSRFALALLTFSLAGLLAAYLGFGKSNPADFPYQSWTSWTLSDFLNQKENPRIVFLGSSLMLVPMDGVEADFLKKRVDGTQHHRSLYFESLMKAATGFANRTFNFALPGEMPSDAYLIVKNLLCGGQKVPAQKERTCRQPQVIIYGVGPRDFLDNLLPSPAATDPFRFLSKFGEIDSIADRLMPDLFQRLDFTLGKLFYFYGQRESLNLSLSRFGERALDRLCPIPAGVTPLNFDERHMLMPALRPWEMLAGQCWFRPSTKADHENFQTGNLAEYKQRYKKLNWNTYISQMRFFAETINLAREKGIEVVVVTMPITDLNRSLLDETSWRAYRSGVIGMAKRKGATVVDFSESRLFKQQDFGDTVHLHSGGGKRFLDLLAERLIANEKFMAALNGRLPADKRIAEQGGRL